MTREIRRIFELWIGGQRTGKTFALMARARALAANARDVSSVWIMDVTGEWNSFEAADVAHVRSWADYLKTCDPDMPRIIIFDDAASWVSWASLVDEAQAQGCVAIILDEVYKWLPPDSRLDEAAERAILSGRHLPALDRGLYPLHLVCACQYPRSVHHLLREQAATICVGKVRGELAESWIRGEAGKDAWDRIQAMPDLHFTVIRGERPKAQGVKWR